MANPSKHITVVIAFLLCSLVSLCLVYGVSAQTMTVKAEASTSQPQVGDTLVVNIKVLNAQNLYGVDVTLNWNPQVLKAISITTLLGVESHPEGVLHESSTYPIEISDESQTDSQYHLLATSTGSSTPSFSGSGTIATVTFNVTSSGSTGLALEAELAQRDSQGNVDLVTPSTSVDSVNVVIPEFPTITVVAVLTIAATATAILAAKLYKNKALYPTALPPSI